MYPNIVNDGAYHVVSVERKGDQMLVTFDNDQIVNLPMTGKAIVWARRIYIWHLKVMNNNFWQLNLLRIISEIVLQPR